MSAVLEIQELDYHYGNKQALDKVSFSLDPGTFTALLGPNGAGKSTLFSLITRLLKSRQGMVKIGGEEISVKPERALEKLGIVFQQPTLDLGLTVRQNLHYFSALRGFSRTHAEARISEEVQRLGIEDIIAKPVRALNGGHRRRVEIARALLHEPDLLLLDEPTVGLDVPTRQQFVQYAHELSTDRGVCVLWATHLIDEVEVSSDRLVVLHQGKIVASGSATSVISESGATDLAAAYTVLTGGISE